MTAIPALISDLAGRSVRVWAEDSRLRASGPSEVLTPELQAALAARREEILGYLERRDRFARDPVLPAARPGPAPLSYAQERIWFLEQLRGPSPTHNMAAAQRLDGRLDRPALAQALAEVIRRHQVLRTAWRCGADGAPVQVVEEVPAAPLDEVDLSTLAPELQERTVAALAAAEAARPFDLAGGRPLRARLLRLGVQRHALLLTVHHIASDGWSNALLGRQVATLYDTWRQGRPSSLPELPVQYADFAVWQRARLSGPWLEDQVAFWRSTLDGAARSLQLPTDRSRPRVQRFHGRTATLALGPALTAELVALARRHEATLHMALLAAFGVLLWRYTGERDLLVGVPTANRPRLELEELIGCFADIAPLRLRLDGEPTFGELLTRVRQSATVVYAVAELPFGLLVEHLQPRRDLSRSPLVQVVFNTQTGEQGSLPLLRLPGAQATPLALEAGTVRLDLEAHARLDGGELVLSFVYDAELFALAAIRRLLTSYRALLAGAVAWPERRIGELPWLAPGERHRLLVEWNAAEAVAGPAATLHRLVLARAAQTPDRIALVSGDACLTYGQLARSARRLAARLRALGVGPEAPVGLCVERSLDMVTGMLGILAAGGAYVPLDPEYPVERLAAMLDDCGAAVVVAAARGREILAGRAAQVVSLEAGGTASVAPADGAAAATTATTATTAATGANLAYLIYTSGSTGRPKGVTICHRSVANLLAAVQARLPAGGAEVWTVCHSCSFDFSVWEIWAPLAGGGRLVIVPADVVRAPAALARLLREQQVTVLHLTPSALQPLLDEVPRREGLPALRWIGSGGEALPPALAAATLAGGFALWNFYGPTEATVWCALSEVAPPEMGAASVPIGGPLANYRLHVVDRRCEPVACGSIGDLLIGGAGLARGYHRRPAFTAERFVPDPFTAAGARLYRSGDLARYRHDGALECLGRTDQQIKLRGFRIELGEIEAVLAAHPAVAEAAVVLWQGEAEDRRLIAYVVAGDGHDLDPVALRRALAERVPRYMLPAAIVRLAEMPRNRSGKLDRRQLAARPPGAPPAATTGAAPGSLLEQAVARCWCSVLGLPSVGIHDNFFDLGGHSLLALRLRRELTAALGRELSVIDLFRFPTIAALAEHLGSAGEPAATAPLPAPAARAERQRQALAQRRRPATAGRRP